MREHFKDIRFKQSTLDTIETANDIISEYLSDGLTLTLRQLYYQFVARDLIANSKQSYDNLGTAISNGRLAGLIDWNAIEDRTRMLRGRNNWDSPAEMLAYNSRSYSIDMWENQNYRLEVWIEKDALLGVIERTCRQNDVDYFACRGYVSQSELYEAGKRFQRYRDDGYEPILIHLGDHDPSGLDMTRDNLERIEMFSGGDVQVHRIALNMDQVRKYNPPANPAKLSDGRAKDYVARFGSSSWELDALEPRILQKLIQDIINDHKDQDRWEDKEEDLRKDKKVLSSAVEQMETGIDYVSRLETAEGHMYDMYLQDDGQAWNEAETYLKRNRPDLIGE